MAHEEIEAALSLERFRRYLDWAGGDRRRALELYALNTRISEALYTPLQMLEVALRNRIHIVMTEARHERWFQEREFLMVENQKWQLARAIKEFREEPTPGDLVAALTFSFWTSMLSPAYEDLWQITLHRTARREDGRACQGRTFQVLSIRFAPYEIVSRITNPSSLGTYPSTTRRSSKSPTGSRQLQPPGAGAIAVSKRCTQQTASFCTDQPDKGLRRSQPAASSSRNARAVTIRTSPCWPRASRSRSPVTMQSAPAARAAAIT